MSMSPEQQSQGRYTFREAMNTQNAPFNLQEKAFLALGPLFALPVTAAGGLLELLNQFSNNNPTINVESVLLHGAAGGLGFGTLVTTLSVGLVANHRGWLVSRESGLRESEQFRYFHPKKS